MAALQGLELGSGHGLFDDLFHHFHSALTLQNTPFIGQTLKGSVDLVVLGAEILLDRS